MLIRHAIVWAAALTLAASASAQTPWEAYLALPSPANARRVERASYSDSAAALGQLEQDLEVVAVQMQAGDRDAVRLAFRLLPGADGDFAETLEIMLGRLIRIHPALFLEEVRRQQQTLPRFDARLNGMLTNTGSPYVDREQADAYEMRRRMDALRSVRAPALGAIRDRCIAVLQRELAAAQARPAP